MSNAVRLFATSALVAACSAPALAGLPVTAYNELIQGDFSGNRLAPTPVAVVPGLNRLIGELAGASPTDGSVDRDFFVMTIPAGYELSAIVLDVYESNDFAAFFSFAAGPVLPFDPATAQPNDPLGYILFGPSEVGFDMLPTMGANTGGFTGPLPAGTYTFWAQQTGEYTLYETTFNITAIPSPAAASLLALAALGASRRRRA